MYRLFVSCVCLFGVLDLAIGQPELEYVQVGKLVGSGEIEGEAFGSSLRVKDGVIVVSSAHATDNPNPSSYNNSVYVFDMKAGRLLSRLLPYDRTKQIGFGSSLDYEDDSVFVGALLDDVLVEYGGSLYQYDVHTREITGRLPHDDGVEYVGVGWQVEVSESLIVTNASGIRLPGEELDQGGAVLIYDRESHEQLSVLKPDWRIHVADSFGSRIAMDQRNLVVSGFGFSYQGKDMNRPIAMYDISDPSNPIERWRIDDPPGFDRLQLGMDGEYVVSTNFDRIQIVNEQTVYVYDVERGELVYTFGPWALERGNYQGFESSLLDVHGNRLAVGYLEGNFGIGVVYIFDLETGRFLQPVWPDQGEAFDNFGTSVAMEGDTLVVGAPHHSNGDSIGAVYVFELRNVDCHADLTLDGTLDYFDVNLFVERFLDQELGADLDNNGQFNFFDISAFLLEFVQGCS